MNKTINSILLLALSVFSGVAFTASYDIKTVKHLFDLTSGGNQPLALPTDVAVSKDRIYVLDGANNRVVVYDIRGKYISEFGNQGKPEDRLNTPVGLTVHANRIYVADTANHMIRVFDRSGKQVSRFPVFLNRVFERPIDLLVSENGKEIFVSGNNHHHIMVFNPQGKLLRLWGGRGDDKGKFRYPATIARLNDNNLVVVDVLNSRAQMFNAKGSLLGVIGKKGVSPGRFFRPKGVAVDARGDIYISDSYMDVVQVFSRQGDLQFIVGRNDEILRFSHPAGMSIRGSHLYVVEMLANKVSVFSLE